MTSVSGSQCSYTPTARVMACFGASFAASAEVDLLLLDELVVDVVIFGELLELAVAQQVDAAVADVHDERLVAEEERGHQRRAHAALLLVRARPPRESCATRSSPRTRAC